MIVLSSPEIRFKLAEANGIMKKPCDKEKLKKYINFCFFLFKKAGIRISCFNSSVAICRVLRSRGSDAKIVFGALFSKSKLEGHCWIEMEKTIPQKFFEPIFKYPRGESNKR